MIPAFREALIAAKVKVREAKKEMNMNSPATIDTAKMWDVIMKELKRPEEEEK